MYPERLQTLQGSLKCIRPGFGWGFLFAKARRKSILESMAKTNPGYLKRLARRARQRSGGADESASTQGGPENNSRNKGPKKTPNNEGIGRTFRIGFFVMLTPTTILLGAISDFLIGTNHVWMSSSVLNIIMLACCFEASRRLVRVWPRPKTICAVCALLCGSLSVASFHALSNFADAEELKLLNGLLKPPVTSFWSRFHRRLPVDSCSICFGANWMITGPNRQIDLIRFCGKPMITLARTPEGAAISGEFFGGDGKIVAEIRTNEFTINPNNYFRKIRPNRSTLAVVDQQNVTVFDVSFTTITSFVFSGTIRLPDASEVLITSNELRHRNLILDHMGFIGSCAFGTCSNQDSGGGTPAHLPVE